MPDTTAVDTIRQISRLTEVVDHLVKDYDKIAKTLYGNGNPETQRASVLGLLNEVNGRLKMIEAAKDQAELDRKAAELLRREEQKERRAVLRQAKFILFAALLSTVFNIAAPKVSRSLWPDKPANDSSDKT
jgi:GH24 family phage-related lysozyme (muramidase)